MFQCAIKKKDKHDQKYPAESTPQDISWFWKMERWSNGAFSHPVYMVFNSSPRQRGRERSDHVTTWKKQTS